VSEREREGERKLHPPKITSCTLDKDPNEDPNKDPDLRVCIVQNKAPRRRSPYVPMLKVINAMKSVSWYRACAGEGVAMVVAAPVLSGSSSNSSSESSESSESRAGAVVFRQSPQPAHKKDPKEDKEDPKNPKNKDRNIDRNII
jgi:hypothetical protein